MTYLVLAAAAFLLARFVTCTPLRPKLAVIGLAFLVAACAGAQLVDHSFEFDALSDSPGIRILDHRYGDSNFPGASNPEHLLKLGQPLQSAHMTGAMKRPDKLYVKWRVLSEDRVYEDTVDLRSRLPRDITNCKVTFMVRGPQLYVYLVHPERRPPDSAPIGPNLYRSRRVTTIYPGEPK
jgi:hypothetical protein